MPTKKPKKGGEEGEVEHQGPQSIESKVSTAEQSSCEMTDCKCALNTTRRFTRYSLGRWGTKVSRLLDHLSSRERKMGGRGQAGREDREQRHLVPSQTARGSLTDL